MGCFNEVVFRCPKCGGRITDQTKSGSCSMKTFSSERVPVEDVSGLDTEHYCNDCNTPWVLKKVKRVKLELVEPEVDDWD